MQSKEDIIKKAEEIINGTRMKKYLNYDLGLVSSDYGCGCCSTDSNISEEDEISSIDSMITEHKEVIEKLEKAKLLLIDARK